MALITVRFLCRFPLFLSCVTWNPLFCFFLFKFVVFCPVLLYCLFAHVELVVFSFPKDVRKFVELSSQRLIDARLVYRKDFSRVIDEHATARRLFNIPREYNAVLASDYVHVCSSALTWFFQLRSYALSFRGVS